MSSERIFEKVTKNIGDPRIEYQSNLTEWKKNRAILQGQMATKDYDKVPSHNNILLPFNSTMTQRQYDFYKAEAELPAVSSQYARMLIGGLLRKNPLLEVNTTLANSEEITDWLLYRFGSANESMVSFLDSALWEELQTSRAWVQIDYPNVDLNQLTREQQKMVCPYPILHNAENIINWDTSINPITGESRLSRVITRYYSRVAGSNQYHDDLQDVVQLHYLDENGYYAIETYVNSNPSQVGPTFIDGQVQQNYQPNNTDNFQLVNIDNNILLGGERMDFIPFVPLNGSVEVIDPMFTPIVDREIALYNKISRRNHLLYLSATYTPVVRSDNLTEMQKDAIANQGLGTWIFLQKDDAIETLSTPTNALTDMDRTIKDGYDELTRIGVKMLSLEPNNADSSGIALQIRNASQNAQIATLNAKVSEAMKRIIHIMIRWKYNINISESEIRFNLSSDFNRISTNSETIRIISEWYQGGIIPRSLFIEIMKNNDLLPSDYSDAQAMNEIESDPLIMSPAQSAQNEVNAIIQQQQQQTNGDSSERNTNNNSNVDTDTSDNINN